MESVNVKVDEYSELHEVEQPKELEDYRTCIYYYEGMLTEEPMILAIEQVSITIESHPMIFESHSDSEL